MRQIRALGGRNLQAGFHAAAETSFDSAFSGQIENALAGALDGFAYAFRFQYRSRVEDDECVDPAFAEGFGAAGFDVLLDLRGAS
jgi:hypothetical protein